MDNTDRNKTCLSCRKCCNILAVTTQFKSSNEFAMEFYNARGIETVINNDDKIVVVLRNMPCPQLGTFGCNIYYDRPAWCKLYDGRSCVVLRDECEWNER